MRQTTQHHIQLGGQKIDYYVVHSPGAHKLHVRVGPNGVEVIQPKKRTYVDIAEFLSKNEKWILGQIQRVEHLRSIRRPEKRKVGEILFRGVPTRVRIVPTHTRAKGNIVRLINGEITIQSGTCQKTPIARSLENWLRQQARVEIESQLISVSERLRCKPGRIYIMGQRTKWGNCSKQKNLSFNWRLILAPDFVLRYLVTHETVHLSVPDHSTKFWLTVQSLCPETERAKQWLSANGKNLMEPLLVDETAL